MLTRPLEDSKELIIKFKSLGYDVSHLPVIKIIKQEIKNIDLLEFAGIIFTSANSVKFLDTKKLNKSIYCFCVGSATEKEALNKGFQNIYAADGNVNNLKELITTNLHKQLIDEDYQVERIVNYNVEHITELDLKFIDQLKKNMPNIIYVYSQNSAKSLLKIIKKYELIDYWMNTNLMCLGEKTSSVLNEIKWKKIFLFNPGEEEFLLYKI